MAMVALISITEGMTPTQYISAVNSNFAVLNFLGSTTTDITDAQTGEQLKNNLNANFATLQTLYPCSITNVDYGQSGAVMVAAINSNITNINSVTAFNNGKLLLTWDDSAPSVYTRAFPMMEAKGVKGTNYLTSDWVATQGFITWGQSKIMQDAGWTIGGHSKTHTSFNTLTASELRAEQAYVAQDFLNNNMNPCLHDAYPQLVPTADKRAIVAETRLSCRGYHSGAYYDNRKTVDKFNIESMPADNTYNELSVIQGILDIAKTNKTAVAILMHGVWNNTGGAGGIDISKLEAIIDYAILKEIDIITMEQFYTLCS